MENKKIGMKVVIVILCLLVIILSGYILYDKFMSKSNITIDNDSEINTYSDNLDKNIDDFGEHLMPYTMIYFYNGFFTNENNKIEYSAYVSLENNLLKICYNDACETLNELKNVIQIIETNEGANVWSKIFYILLNDGTVYEYILNYDKSENTLNKVENLSNVRILTSYGISKQNAGGSWGVFALTSDGKHVELFSSGV